MTMQANPFAELRTAAYLVRHEHRAGHEDWCELCLDRAVAEDHAAQHHGTIHELLLRDDVEELLAWRRGSSKSPER